MKRKFIALLGILSLCATAIPCMSVPSYAAEATVPTVASYNVLAGTTTHVLPVYTQTAGVSYEYSSNNTSVATVDASGNVTGVSAGAATILVKRTLTTASSNNSSVSQSGTPTGTPTGTTAAPTPTKATTASNESGEGKGLQEAALVARDSNVVGASWAGDDTTPTPTAEVTEGPSPTSGKYIEGWGATAIPSPSPTPEAGEATVTPTESASVTKGASSGSVKESGGTNSLTVVSYAAYTVNVYPFEVKVAKDSIGLGDSVQFSTNIAHDVDWYYEDEASVDTGNVFSFTPTEVGTYTVTAEYNGAKASQTVKVVAKSEKQLQLEKKAEKKAKDRIKQDGFSFTDAVSDMAVGDAITFSTNMSKVANAKVMWSSSDDSVATVTENGTVVAMGPGTVKIKATCLGNKITKTITVAAESKFKFTDTVDEMAYKDSYTFKTNRSEGVTWSSENENVLLCNNGVITAVGIGNAKITAEYQGATLSKTVYVTGDSSILRVTSSENTVNVGECICIETNRTGCAFKSSKQSVATVDASTGIVTGKSVGTTTITVQCGDEYAQYVVTVTKGTSDLAFIGVQDSYATGSRTVLHTNKKGANYLSTNTAVAVIDQQTGELRALTPGTTMIYAFNGSEKISKQITITSGGKNTVLNSLVVGDTVTLTTSSTNVTWSTSNPNVVDLDQSSGKLKAIGAGECYVYAYSDDNICYFTVRVKEGKYTEEQQKLISTANKTIKSLLSSDGTSVRPINSSNTDTIAVYLREARAKLDECEEAGIKAENIASYNIYDAALNQYLVFAKEYSNGEVVDLAQGKRAALANINQAIVKLTTTINEEEIEAQVSVLDDMIYNAKRTYLVTEAEIESYDTYLLYKNHEYESEPEIVEPDESITPTIEPTVTPAQEVTGGLNGNNLIK